MDIYVKIYYNVIYVYKINGYIIMFYNNEIYIVIVYGKI